jgi:two-component system, cell cycle response regulator DivK
MSPAKKPSPPRNSSREPLADAPLILVVDDFEDNRAMYVEYLQFQGFRVAEAVNGEEAVTRTRELLPAVIVMDLSLPVMDGWEATRRVKADPKTKHIRVIALTGHAEPAHAKKALEAGCDDFVAKPCLPENLLAKIREHLTSSERAAASSREDRRDDRTKKAQKGKK